ncbi:MAG: NRDE family protein [Jatrophihabitans sp.]
MCTVICRWAPDGPIGVQLLALRDEWASRSFDLPGAWWPDQPAVIGGRDRLGGGTWCASDVATGVSAVVLNRGEQPVAVTGAPSRGTLPLLAVRHRAAWPEEVSLAGMASFNLVLATPSSLAWWAYDGVRLHVQTLRPGTHIFTPRGLAGAPLDPRFRIGNAELADANAATEVVWSGWLPIVTETEPSADPAALLVRIPRGADSFETVFGQFIAARPGSLRLDYVRTPDRRQPWTVARWTMQNGTAAPTLERDV